VELETGEHAVVVAPQRLVQGVHDLNLARVVHRLRAAGAGLAVPPLPSVAFALLDELRDCGRLDVTQHAHQPAIKGGGDVFWRCGLGRQQLTASADERKAHLRR